MKTTGLLFIIGLFVLGITSCEKVAKNGTNPDSLKSKGKTDDHSHEGENTSGIPLTTVQWTEVTHDFGKINDVDSVGYIYKFTNTGNNPLKVENVKPTCGCTAGRYSPDPVPPGKEGFVELKFSPHGKGPGQVSKTATVKMNTDPSFHSLQFSADIQVKK